MRTWMALVVLAACAVIGCSKESVCAAGSTQQCVCADGARGAQSCSDEGDKWGSCACSKGGAPQNTAQALTPDPAEVAPPRRCPDRGASARSDGPCEADCIVTRWGSDDEQWERGSRRAGPCGLSPRRPVRGGPRVCVRRVQGLQVCSESGREGPSRRFLRRRRRLRVARVQGLQVRAAKLEEAPGGEVVDRECLSAATTTPRVSGWKEGCHSMRAPGYLLTICMTLGCASSAHGPYYGARPALQRGAQERPHDPPPAPIPMNARRLTGVSFLGFAPGGVPPGVCPDA
jgi:hypothetical protein